MIQELRKKWFEARIIGVRCYEGPAHPI